MSRAKSRPAKKGSTRGAHRKRAAAADSAAEELKRLNEELERRVAERTDELARREREFRTLADNVPAMFSYLDAEQRYRYVNRRYQKQWDRPAAEIIGMTVEELLGPQAYAVARPHIQEVLAGKQVTYQADFEFADGRHTMQVNYVPDLDERGRVQGFFTLVDDITPLKRIERALREREGRLRAIMSTAPDAIITIDRKGVIINFNRAAERIFGYTRSEALGRNVRILMPSPYCEEHDGYLARYEETGEPHMIGIRREVRGRRKDGSVFPLEVTVTEVEGVDLFVGITRDLSAQRRLEQEVAEASTFEQERIGQEIHDGLGQKLTALSMMAASLKRELEKNDLPASRTLDDLIAHLQQATGEARALSRGLAPVPLTEQGLADALRKLGEEMQLVTGVACHFETDPACRVDVENRTTAMQLYRIAQEAVHNAVKHGAPRNITIRLELAGRSPQLTISDDGRGFVPNNHSSEGFGLRIMHYRAAIIGGELRIESGEQTGTRVRCRLSPVDLQSANSDKQQA